MSELKYTQHGDCLLPEMELTEEEQRPLGRYGMMRQQYLASERPGLYTRLLLSGRLMMHLHEIEQSAQNRLNRLMHTLPKQNGVTEDMKAENPMRWAAQMNNLKHQAEEMILSELIYS